VHAEDLRDGVRADTIGHEQQGVPSLHDALLGRRGANRVLDSSLLLPS
jgi:hypothetical protein